MSLEHVFLVSVLIPSFKASVTKQIFLVVFYWKFGCRAGITLQNSESLKWRLFFIYKFFRHSHCWKFVDYFPPSLSPATLHAAGSFLYSLEVLISLAFTPCTLSPLTSLQLSRILSFLRSSNQAPEGADFTVLNITGPLNVLQSTSLGQVRAGAAWHPEDEPWVGPVGASPGPIWILRIKGDA